MAKKITYRLVDNNNWLYTLINKDNLSKIIIKEENYNDFCENNKVIIEQKED